MSTTGFTPMWNGIKRDFVFTTFLDLALYISQHKILPGAKWNQKPYIKYKFGKIFKHNGLYGSYIKF